jgi:hypothetical protein
MSKHNPIRGFSNFIHKFTLLKVLLENECVNLNFNSSDQPALFNGVRGKNR